MTEYAELARFVATSQWAILPSSLEMIVSLTQKLIATPKTRAEIQELKSEIQAATGRQRREPRQDGGKVGVVPIIGVITHRPTLLSFFFGGTSTMAMQSQIRELASDKTVETIVLDIDSPGGVTDGVTELWQVIYEARQKKKVIAVANTMAASAAYWLGSAASEFVATPSGSVGSIGVIHVHAEETKLLEKAGIKVHVTAAGKFKGEGNPFEPLTDEGKQNIKKRVIEVYTIFVKDIGRGRGVALANVRQGFGEGRMLGAKEAKELGMIDRIATFDQTVGFLASGQSADMEFRRRRALALAAGPVTKKEKPTFKPSAELLRARRRLAKNQAKQTEMEKWIGRTT